MVYEHSLTYAAQMQIDHYIEKQTAKADELLDRQQTAEELLCLLTSGTELNTPDFVLRRHIQAQGGLVSQKECADLSQIGNVPWPQEVVSRVAKDLSSISYQRHGLVISTANWEKYLVGSMPQGFQREMIFKLAIVTGMGRESTIDLLLSCGQAPYNMREPLELICWFCQYVPGVYTWRGVQRLLRDSMAFCSEPKNTAVPATPSQGATQLLRQSVDELLGMGDPEGELAEQRLLELIAENRWELDGFSRTAQEKYLRLMKYLSALYLPGKRSNSHKLISAMYQAQNWNFEDLFQTSTRERYVFRGIEGDEKYPRYENCVLDQALGKIALFCKRYYARANAVQNGKKSVDRQDVLLLGYFLITGYGEKGGACPDQFWALATGDSDMDLRMALLREELDALSSAQSMKEKQVLYCRILNELLAEFGFRFFYFPAAFDRFILLSLLTDSPAWTAGYLLGQED